MLFKRKIYNQLLEWKQSSHGSSALLIEGARRVGKSTIVEEFAKQEYKHYLLINFSTVEQTIKDNFANINHLDTFFRNLMILTGVNLESKNSLIIFDEVQFFPPARQAIKLLVKDGRYDYIETGSLISIRKNVKDILIPSEEEHLQMYPMDFEEFLWAQNNFTTMDVIRDSFNKKEPLGQDIHRTILKIFRTYMAVGGMPQAVDAYIKGESYRTIDHIKKNILTLYREDLYKHDDEDGDHAEIIFNSLPAQLMNHNSSFHLSQVKDSYRYQTSRNAINFLNESMIVNCCNNVTNPEITLELYADKSNFKMFLGDTGLLVSDIISEKGDLDKIYRALIIDKLSVNLGMIFENVTAQMLRANGYKLYFHEFNYKPLNNKKEKKCEVDFLLVNNHRLIPLEVKSSSYTIHNSFDFFKEKYSLKIPKQYIVYTKDLKVENNITYIPIYMVPCL